MQRLATAQAAGRPLAGDLIGRPGLPGGPLTAAAPGLAQQAR
jgi:hypothetical protein